MLKRLTILYVLLNLCVLANAQDDPALPYYLRSDNRPETEFERRRRKRFICISTTRPISRARPSGSRRSW